MSYDDRLGDYIDVPTRIVEFRNLHPQGSLQPADLAQPYRVETIGDQTYIVVVAAAYRTPDDPRPGIGMAYEVFPGKTPYTKGSELQNAETSAWGRSIVAALAADTKRGIASAEEVRNRRADGDAAQEQPPAPMRDDQKKIMFSLWAQVGYAGPDNRDARLQVTSAIVGRPVASSSDLSVPEATAVILALRKRAADLPAKEAQQ